MGGTEKKEVVNLILWHFQIDRSDDLKELLQILQLSRDIPGSETLTLGDRLSG